MQVALEEGQVVVAAVPQHDVGLGLGHRQDAGVVDAGEDHDAAIDVRLVFLALLDRALVLVEVVVVAEALRGLGHQVAVRHRMPHRHHAQPLRLQGAGHSARGLRLAGTGAGRADRDHGLRRATSGVLRPDQPEVGAGGQHPRGLMHDEDVWDVAVRESHLVDALVADQALQLGFGVDRDAGRVERASQLGRIDPALDVRDLSGRERDHPLG